MTSGPLVLVLIHILILTFALIPIPIVLTLGLHDTTPYPILDLPTHPPNAPRLRSITPSAPTPGYLCLFLFLFLSLFLHLSLSLSLSLPLSLARLSKVFFWLMSFLSFFLFVFPLFLCSTFFCMCAFLCGLCGLCGRLYNYTL